MAHKTVTTEMATVSTESALRSGMSIVFSRKTASKLTGIIAMTDRKHTYIKNACGPKDPKQAKLTMAAPSADRESTMIKSFASASITMAALISKPSDCESDSRFQYLNFYTMGICKGDANQEG
jgi:hypothetical protein